MGEHGGCCTPPRTCGEAGASVAAGNRDVPVVDRVTATAVSVRGMIELGGGPFLMGSDDGTYPDDGEGPVREVTLRPFLIDAAAVTNRQFEKFAKATGYQTEAERFGWSFVFHLLVRAEERAKRTVHPPGLPWWRKVPGACWRNPEGRGSSIRDRMDHPAVHISWNDAVAYCAWAGKRLPTEAEYEYAARGGLVQRVYPWGDELTPGGEHRCNIWQGTFPTVNTEEDGYLGTAPARTFPSNGYGLYNMSGNVWEWCSDWWSPSFHVNGPRRDPAGPPDGASRVMKGGSYLCHESYCNRYRVSARSANTPDSSTGNLGFRCVADVG